MRLGSNDAVHYESDLHIGEARARACACVSFVFMSREEEETRGVYLCCKVVSPSLESVAVVTFLDVLRYDHCVLVRIHVKAPKETHFCCNSPNE